MTECLPDCLRPCRDTFERIAKEAPELLIAWVQTGYGLGDADLSFACEALGAVDDQNARLVLERRLEHANPIVREGAVLGIAAAIGSHAKAPEWRKRGMRIALDRVSAFDPSPGAREAAQDALDSLSVPAREDGR